MLTRADIGDLLQMHARGYQLLLWLDRQAAREPSVLAPDVVALLAKPASCGAWLVANRFTLPLELRPENPVRDEFVNLFASFFSTSFHVEHLSFGGELLDSRLAKRSTKSSHKPKGSLAAQALALKHLASSQSIRISEAEARKFAERKSSQPHLLLWTYVWELDRRAKAKGKGEVVHRIWRSLPLATRKNLSTDAVWAAREELLGKLHAAMADVPEN